MVIHVHNTECRLLRPGAIKQHKHKSPIMLTWSSAITRLAVRFICGLMSDLVGLNSFISKENGLGKAKMRHKPYPDSDLVVFQQ